MASLATTTDGNRSKRDHHPTKQKVSESSGSAVHKLAVLRPRPGRGSPPTGPPWSAQHTTASMPYDNSDPSPWFPMARASYPQQHIDSRIQFGRASPLQHSRSADVSHTFQYQQAGYVAATGRPLRRAGSEPYARTAGPYARTIHSDRSPPWRFQTMPYHHFTQYEDYPADDAGTRHTSVARHSSLEHPAGLLPPFHDGPATTSPPRGQTHVGYQRPTLDYHHAAGSYTDHENSRQAL